MDDDRSWNKIEIPTALIAVTLVHLAGCGSATSEPAAPGPATEPAATDRVADTEPAEPVATAPSEQPTAQSPAMVHCDARELMGTCEERPADSAGDLQSNCESAAAAFAEGPCPLEERFGTCQIAGQPPLHVYCPAISTQEAAERICVQAEFVPVAE